MLYLAKFIQIGAVLRHNLNDFAGIVSERCESVGQARWKRTMTIGLLFSAICAGLLAGAAAVSLEAGLAVAALSYVLGGGLGVGAFVSLAARQLR